LLLGDILRSSALPQGVRNDVSLGVVVVGQDHPIHGIFSKSSFVAALADELQKYINIIPVRCLERRMYVARRSFIL